MARGSDKRQPPVIHPIKNLQRSDGKHRGAGNQSQECIQHHQSCFAVMFPPIRVNNIEKTNRPRKCRRMQIRYRIGRAASIIPPRSFRANEFHGFFLDWPTRFLTSPSIFPISESATQDLDTSAIGQPWYSPFSAIQHFAPRNSHGDAKWPESRARNCMCPMFRISRH